MKSITIVLLLLLASSFAIAQKENSNWIINPKQALDINTRPLTIQNTSIDKYSPPYNVDRWCAVSAANGDLLFYTDGNTVWDKNHDTLLNGTSISQTNNRGSGWGKDSTSYHIGNVVIVPMPANPNKYYIFTTGLALEFTSNGYQRYFSLPKYSIVDMTLNNGKGGIANGQKNILLYPSDAGRVNAAAGTGMCNKWIAYTSRYTDELFTHQIDGHGINTTPVRSSTSISYPQMMKFSNDNSKLAIAGSATTPKDSATPNKPPYTFALYDFDPLTGIASNELIINQINITQNKTFYFDFSADNSKLYYYTVDSTQFRYYQIDLSQPNNSAVLASSQLVFTRTNNYAGTRDLLLADNNKIYQLIDTNKFLVIGHPNKKGTACDIHYETVNPQQPLIPTSTSPISYQNHVPASRLNYAYSDFNICSFPAKLSSQKSNADSYTWSTGATSQDITINQNGTYWVKAADACGAYRVDSFHIKFSPPIPINDTFACNGQQVTIPLDKDAAYTWHNNSQGATFDSTGTYYVTIDKGQCGALKDTFFVKIYPKKDTKLLPEDTIVCNEDFTTLLSSSQDLGQYTWSTGASTKTISATTQNTYWLTSNTPCGIYSDTVEVSFCKPQIDSLILPSTICSGTCIDITALTSNYPKQYQWSFIGAEPTSSVSKDAYVCFYDTGAYNIVLNVSSPGGSAQKDQQIRVVPSPSLRFSDTSLSAKYKTQLTLLPCASAEQISWFKNDRLICKDCDTLTILAKDLRSSYKCVLKNYDCSDSCTYFVDVTDIATEVWLPSAFSPNNDGKNDYFRIITDNPNVIITNFSIYNRFGQRIYREDGRSNKGWDGTYNGKTVDIGTYYWLLKYKIDGSNEEFLKKGDVMLVH